MQRFFRDFLYRRVTPIRPAKNDRVLHNRSTMPDGYLRVSPRPIFLSNYTILQVAIYRWRRHALCSDQPLSAGAPASLKVSWARAHLALILIIIVVVGAAAGGGTYYVLSMNRGSTIFFYESLAPPEVDFFQHQLVPQFEAANPGTNVILVNLSGPSL